MNTQLTNDQDRMIVMIYKRYLESVKSGKSKVASNRFNINDFLGQTNPPGMHDDDIQMTIVMLAQKQFLKIYMGGDFEIKDQGIIYMENRFKKGLIEVTDFIAKWIP